MAKGYAQNGHEMNGDKSVENGAKMRDFGAFWLKLNGLSCLAQTGIRNNYYAQAAHGKEVIVSSKNIFARNESYLLALDGRVPIRASCGIPYERNESGD